METTAAYREWKSRGGMADLSDRLMLQLTGADRVRYLNGQVTSNVTRLSAGQTQPACVTTAKGRLCAEIVITAGTEALFVDADPALRETLPARLERYIIADDVTLTECPPETRLLHFLGGDNFPAEVPAEATLHAADRFGAPGFDWWTDAPTLAAVWPKLIANRVVLDEPLRELLRIEAGIPGWGSELGEDTLPPEAGLDRTHIDYHKGCYVGQEVISRLKSVGHVNRQLTGFVSESGAPLAPGASLFLPGDDTRAVGQLTSAAYSFTLEKPIALGYLKRGSPTRDLIARPADSNSAEVIVTACALPFSP